MLRVPALLKAPPLVALLSEMVELAMLRVAPLMFSIAPPNDDAELFERVELAMLRVPALLKAPP